MVDREEVRAAMAEVQDLLYKVAAWKQQTSHPDQLRQLKLIDAELMDALHSFQRFLEMLGEADRHLA